MLALLRSVDCVDSLSVLTDVSRSAEGSVTIAGCSRSLLADAEFYELPPFRNALAKALCEELDTAVNSYEPLCPPVKFLSLLNTVQLLPVGYLPPDIAGPLAWKLLCWERSQISTLASLPAALPAFAQLITALHAGCCLLVRSADLENLPSPGERATDVLQSLESASANMIPSDNGANIMLAEATKATGRLLSEMELQVPDAGDTLRAVLAFCAAKPMIRSSGTGVSCKIAISHAVLVSLSESGYQVTAVCTTVLLQKWQRRAFREAARISIAEAAQRTSLAHLLGALGASLELSCAVDGDWQIGYLAATMDMVWSLIPACDFGTEHVLLFVRSAFRILHTCAALASGSHERLQGVLANLLQRRVSEANAGAALQTAAVLYRYSNAAQRETMVNLLLTGVQQIIAANDTSLGAVATLRASFELLACLLGCVVAHPDEDFRIDAERCLAVGMSAASLPTSQQHDMLQLSESLVRADATFCCRILF